MQKANKRKLTVQPLESRNVLAGNVIGGIVGNTLSLTGDVDHNQFIVEEIASNQFQVTGLSGTTINSAGSQIFTASQVDNVIINTLDGDDQVIVNNVSLTDSPLGNLQIRTSGGDDVVSISNTTTRSPSSSAPANKTM